MTAPTMRQRVDAGIALLDEHCGPAWPWDIDLARLDLELVCDCVLGQKFRSFGAGVTALDLWGYSADYGFAEEGRRWRRLTWLWRRRIGELREQRGRVAG